MHWKKLGLVYTVEGARPWAKSHAMIPTPVRLNDDVVRVYVTHCDAQGIGRPGYVDLSAADPRIVLGFSQRPLLELGRAGSFDENGVLACSVVPLGDGRLFMYYVGFELGTKIRYRLLTGLAISQDGGETFTRYSQTPVLERSDAELHFRCGPYCLLEDGRFRLWYVAGSDWTDVGGKPMPVYDIRYVESADGIHWPHAGQRQIAITQPDEHGFGRPWVVRKADRTYRMFYSVRRRSFNAYRLGYAESADGAAWQRLDEAMNLDCTPGSFDSTAIMYAAPLTVGDRTYLFYNGDDFGRDGFAAAVLESE